MNSKLIEELKGYTLKGAAIVTVVIASISAFPSAIIAFQFVSKQMMNMISQNQEK
jgi:hypothetical protein